MSVRNEGSNTGIGPYVYVGKAKDLNLPSPGAYPGACPRGNSKAVGLGEFVGGL